MLNYNKVQCWEEDWRVEVEIIENYLRLQTEVNVILEYTLTFCYSIEI